MKRRKRRAPSCPVREQCLNTLVAPTIMAFSLFWGLRADYLPAFGEKTIVI